MGSLSKNAILRALFEGSIVELMVKSNVENIYVDGTTTLASKLSEIILSLNSKAASSALETGLAARPTTTEMNTAISTAISELINGAPETYDTLKELADYISEHGDVVATLNDAIGSKADLSALNELRGVVDGLGSLARLNEVGENNLSAALKEKVNAASEGNHSHNNKTLLDTYTQTEANLADAVSKKHAHSNKALLDTYTQTDANLKDAVSKKHTHSNGVVLDAITSDDVDNWSGKGKFYAQTTQPADLAEGDLWAQII